MDCAMLSIPEHRKISPMSLLQVNDLHTSFHTRNGIVRAVQGVSFEVNKGETLGIVGESGSGKSVTCFSLLDLIPKPPGRIEAGEALFGGKDLLTMTTAELNQYRGDRIAMIFQDPMTSLNPYLRIEDQLIEPLLIHGKADKVSAKNKALEALKMVGIQDAEKRLRHYPHEFSGGMRQRVVIAMALITEPDLLIADEPTTALDVTVQAQIMELIGDLQAKMGMAVILITHDLGLVAGFCDRVHVMYAGRIVETGNTDQLFRHPSHPYTQALQRSIPSLRDQRVRLDTIDGAPPDLIGQIQGCAFAPRCQHRNDSCQKDPYPELASTQQPEQASACRRFILGELSLDHE